MSTLFLVIAATMFVLVLTATRPPLTHRSAAYRPPWFPVMLVTELAPALLGATVAFGALGVWVGAWDGPVGVVAAILAVLSASGLAFLIWRAGRTGRALSSAAKSLGADSPRSRINWLQVLVPNPYRIPNELSVVEGVEYTPGFKLDVYRLSDGSDEPAPVLVYVHGGSWSGGNRRQQGRPMLHSFALRGWATVSIDYPLVPDATFPEPLVGVHGAIAWVRSNAADFGFDTRRIVVAGGSSGAHLASLAALTDDHPTWGAREVGDEPIAAAVGFYGVYDLLDRHDIRDAWPIVSQGLLKADLVQEPDKFRAASPIDQVHEDAPPFLVLHGDHDSLVPLAESRYFADALREASRRSVTFVPVPGATHAFDAVPSLRTQLVLSSVSAMLDSVVQTSDSR